MNEFKHYIKEINWLRAGLYGKNLVSAGTCDSRDVQQIMFTAKALDYLFRQNISAGCFRSGMVLLYPGQVPTGILTSFAAAVNFLGLTLQVAPDPVEVSPLYEIIACLGDSLPETLAPMEEGPRFINLELLDDEGFQEVSGSLRTFAYASLILNLRFENPGRILETLLKKNIKRKGF